VNFIKVTNMNKSYSNTPILKNLNFFIQEGEFVGFLGPSGCGKSTLLSIIAGLNFPSSGSVENTFLNENSSSFVFQEASLMPWRTVEKNVALPLEILKKDEETLSRDVYHKLKMFKLENYKNYYPRQLSGGMKMRTSIARALVTNPKILFMDEPFSSLDQLLREKCAEEVLEIWKQEKLTSILITHSIPEAVYLCQKIFILSSKPSQIIEVIEIPSEFQYAKNSQFKDSDLFKELCKKIRLIMEKYIYE
jgi:NitT/TauT family transport system ATP-binding protein